MLLTICHATTYTYVRPVALLPHRLRLRPRDTHQLTTRSASLECTPSADLEWTQDVFGNLIAIASFSASTAKLTVNSRLLVDQRASEWPLFPIAPHAHHYPFDYSADERADLGSLLTPEPDPQGRLRAWSCALIAANPTDTLSLLQDLNAAVARGIAYVERGEEGTQAALETLDTGTGTCRDLATLFIEAARVLGFGARAVSGYLFDPTNGSDAPAQHGATHAWAEVYLPGAGWIAFDPTQNRMGEANLVPVAVARSITQIQPIEGRFLGSAEDDCAMTVEVWVTAEADSARNGDAVEPAVGDVDQCKERIRP
jgi:transglutaminase-like putative cysteine protease